MTGLFTFLVESLAIEGIYRAPTPEEIDSTKRFLALSRTDVDAVCELQAAYAPERPLRTRPGMNVTVGNHVPSLGGPAIGYALIELLDRLEESDNPWREHVAFETLRPFADGNGRVGRAIWAWHMMHLGRDPFRLGFLHAWYYDTLAIVDLTPQPPPLPAKYIGGVISITA